jgi:hypothetical protein
MATVWRVLAGGAAEFARECEAGGFVALGFGAFGRSVEGMDKAAIQAAARERYPDNKWSHPAGTLHRFANVMADGDVVFVPTDEGSYLVGTVSAPYRYSPEPLFKDFHHYREVHWLGAVPNEDLSPQVRPSPRGTLIEPAAQAELMRIADAVGEGRLLSRAQHSGDRGCTSRGVSSSAEQTSPASTTWTRGCGQPGCEDSVGNGPARPARCHRCLTSRAPSCARRRLVREDEQGRSDGHRRIRDGLAVPYS